jgi:hypothetical protein
MVAIRVLGPVEADVDGSLVPLGAQPLSGTWHGREAIVSDFLGGVGQLVQQDSLLALELTSIISDGGQVVAEWTSRATTVTAPRTTTAASGSLPYGTGRSLRCGSTPTPSTSSMCCSAAKEATEPEPV